jgi:hypothetical protein
VTSATGFAVVRSSNSLRCQRWLQVRRNDEMLDLQHLSISRSYM